MMKIKEMKKFFVMFLNEKVILLILLEKLATYIEVWKFRMANLKFQIKKAKKNYWSNHGGLVVELWTDNRQKVQHYL